MTALCRWKSGGHRVKVLIDGAEYAPIHSPATPLVAPVGSVVRALAGAPKGRYGTVIAHDAGAALVSFPGWKEGHNGNSIVRVLTTLHNNCSGWWLFPHEYRVLAENTGGRDGRDD